jgi:hypothetical protein
MNSGKTRDEQNPPLWRKNPIREKVESRNAGDLRTGTGA